MINIALNIKLSRNITILLVFIFVCLSAMGGYYFYWTKTPEYSLRLVQEAIQNHDLEKFKTHVDMDTFISHAVDDLFSESISKTIDNKEASLFSTGFLQLLKPTIVNMIKEKVVYYVENGNAKKPTSVNQQTNDKNSTPMDKEINRKMDFNSFDFKGIAFSNKDGKIATVGINLFNKQVEKTFTLNIKLRELQDGMWQIIEVANLKEFFNDLEKAKYVYYSNQPSVVNALKISDSDYKDDICTLIYPKVEIPDNRQAEEKINQAIQGQVNNAIEQGKRISQLKKYGPASYSVKLQYKVQLNNGRLLSVTFDNFTYSGGVHGSVYKLGMTFDAKTGDSMEWTDLYPALDDMRLAKLNQSVLQQSTEKKKTLFMPFKGLKTGKLPVFYVNENRKPIIIFQPYEIAAFAFGVLEFEIPSEVYGN